MRIAVVGAGMAGLSCAEALRAAGADVELFDKGRGAGGRMAARRVETPAGTAAFDFGAQYVTVRSDGFARALEGWRAAGAVAPWPAAGEGAFVFAPAMNAALKLMAGTLPVRWGARVERLAPEAGRWRLDGEGWSRGGYDAAVVALPAEQCAALLAEAAPALAAEAAATPSAPCWAAMAAFPAHLEDAPDVLRADGGPLGWAARTLSRPGRSGPEALVLQGSPEWSSAVLEEPAEAAAETLLEAFWVRTGLPRTAPLHLSAHRWRFARSGAFGEAAGWDGERRVGVCGDWRLGPRVEAAWESGRALAARIAAGPAR